MDREGAQLESVTAAGFAEKLGLQRGDLIKTINGLKITAREDIPRALQATVDDVRLTIVRNGKSMELSLAWPVEQP